MKVLLINQTHFPSGGANTVYLNTGRILEQHGHEVVYFAQKSSQNEITPWSRYFYDGPRTKRQLVLCDFGNKKAKEQLEKLLNDVKPEIAHIHELGNISGSIYSVLKKYRIPIVQTVHDYHFVCPVSHFLDGEGKSCELCRDRKYYRCAFRRCSKGRFLESAFASFLFYYNRRFANPTKVFDGMIYVSNYSAQKNIEHFCQLERIKHTVIYNSAKETQHSSLRGDYFLYFGRLSYEKGVDVLIKAFLRTPNLQLKVVGTGPLESELKLMVCNSPNIVFTGYKSGNDLSDLISHSSYVIVPSICYENNPMAIVEGYSFGKPVIGADSGAIPEIVSTNTGLLFEKNNVEALVSAVLNADALTIEEYKRLSNGAKAFFRENFTDEKYYTELVSFYQQILNKAH